jgi:hypothetical protein
MSMLWVGLVPVVVGAIIIGIAISELVKIQRGQKA